MGIAESVAIGGMGILSMCIYFVYGWAGKSLKQRPWIPFLMGTVMLMLFVSWYAYEYHHKQSMESDVAWLRSEKAKEISNKTQFQALTEQMIIGADWVMKLLELVGIPFSTFLVAFAVQAKAEKSFLDYQKDFDATLKTYHDLSDRYSKKKDALIQMLESGAKGPSLIELHEEVRNLSRQVSYWDDRIQDSFPDLSGQVFSRVR